MLSVGRGLDKIDTRSITIDMKKTVWAITAALPSIIPNPATPAISAMIKNKIALRIIIQVFKKFVNGEDTQKIMPFNFSLKFFVYLNQRALNHKQGGAA